MPRADSLTGLRWWAAFGVFAYHMEVFAPIPIKPVLDLGYLGVTFFFVLSGFVLTWSWSPSVGAARFWWRRFARIYPANLVALSLAIPVFYAVAPDPAQWWVKPFGPVLILSVLLVQGWSRDSTILFSGNPAAWTLTCEAFFYALHPAIQRPLTKVGRRGALVGALLVVVLAFSYRFAAAAVPGAWWAAQLPWPVIRLTEFALGMCMAWAVREGFRPRVGPWVGYLVAAVTVGVLVFAISPSSSALTGALGAARQAVLASVGEIAMVACAILIVLVASRDLRGGRSLLRTRVLVVLGEWSYSFYLVHATVMYVLLVAFGPHPMAWANLWWYAVTFLVALAVAGALHLGVEKPVERLMRAWYDRRHPQSRPTPSAAA